MSGGTGRRPRGLSPPAAGEIRGLKSPGLRWRRFVSGWEEPPAGGEFKPERQERLDWLERPDRPDSLDRLKLPEKS
jgi:hypothetical protein